MITEEISALKTFQIKNKYIKTPADLIKGHQHQINNILDELEKNISYRLRKKNTTCHLS